ncbi:glycosyltransferase family A protein [Ruicaihuangia caeni]|uniref:glycosyltransferase family A protein n=1 Tax=Ruicaihuangia caeni TaxID=3042517 RepID=UPI00338FB116
MTPRLVALLPVFNDARYLAGWFDRVGSQVDAVVALDDGSTDASRELLRAAPCVTRLLTVGPAEKLGWNEPLNRERLVRAGQELEGEWFIAFDADERPERRLWERMPQLLADADRDGIDVLDFALREVWDEPDHYRSDGLWGLKRKAAVFRNLGDDHEFDPAQWHGEWYPMQCHGTDRIQKVDFDLYHLKMLHADDRRARMERYQTVDPDAEYQSVGYDYLCDESGLQLTKITRERAY